MSVYPFRRFAVLLAVSVVLFLIPACQSTTSTDPKSQKVTRTTLMSQDVSCEESNKSMSRPLICVDDQTRRAVPQSVRIHDVEASRDGTPTKHRVKVHWFTKRSANLQIQYRTLGCRVLTPPACDQRGHCEAMVREPLGVGAKPQSCTYGILVDELADPDGEVIIQPCCY